MSTRAGKQPVPPSKGKAAASKRKAVPPVRPPDSSDEDAPLSAPKASRAGVARFDKDKVLAAVKTVRGKVPGLLSSKDMADWQEWHLSVPTDVGSVASSALPLPLRMPVKCTSEPPKAVAPAVVREQRELMTFSNAASGRGERRHRTRPRKRPSLPLPPQLSGR
jgi:hypothetical protein